MNEQYCIIERSFLARIIDTLKSIDVRGYDSMDALVGCVTVLNGLYDNGKIGMTPVPVRREEGESKTKEE